MNAYVLLKDSRVLIKLANGKQVLSDVAKNGTIFNRQ